MAALVRPPNRTPPVEGAPPRRNPAVITGGVLLAAAVAVAVVLVVAPGDKPTAEQGPSAVGLALTTTGARTVTTTPSRTGARAAATTPSRSSARSTTTTTQAPASGPARTVTAYFDAINRRDYGRAWELGGRNLDTSYEHFVAGLSTTAHETVRITSESGDIVHIELSARQTDGSVRMFSGYYIVRNDVIVDAVIR
ncbi:hypothetical protein IU450_21530 [Nocardia abscessus]|uniref:hypothetical protein n=1 Tax=Nocardia abscessus TaxID=120957 RepID=UPI001895F869|nr:hypothetical protein [Nocardia abscessus]MBF6338456.1 hypothetical protein [Nocardia abscessus]